MSYPSRNCCSNLSANSSLESISRNLLFTLMLLLKSARRDREGDAVEPMLEPAANNEKLREEEEEEEKKRETESEESD